MNSSKIQEVIDKYEKYVKNIQWHIDVNNPVGTDLDNCKNRIKGFNEILFDLKHIRAEQFKQQQSAGVWVKASERLPNNRHESYFIRRLIGNKQIKSVAFINDNEDELSWIRYNYEWLDESQQHPVITDEEIEELAQKIYPRQHPWIQGCYEAGFIKGYKAAINKQ